MPPPGKDAVRPTREAIFHRQCLKSLRNKHLLSPCASIWDSGLSAKPTVPRSLCSYPHCCEKNVDHKTQKLNWTTVEKLLLACSYWGSSDWANEEGGYCRRPLSSGTQLPKEALPLGTLSQQPLGSTVPWWTFVGTQVPVTKQVQRHHSTKQ